MMTEIKFDSHLRLKVEIEVQTVITRSQRVIVARTHWILLILQFFKLLVML